MTLVELLSGKRDCGCEDCQRHKAILAAFCKRFPKASIDELCARFEMARALAGEFRKVAGLRNGPMRSDVLHVAAAAAVDVLAGVFANLPEQERKALLPGLPGVLEKEIAADRGQARVDTAQGFGMSLMRAAANRAASAPRRSADRSAAPCGWRANSRRPSKQTARGSRQWARSPATAPRRTTAKIPGLRRSV
jgi:hypothetical protein